MIYLGVDLGTSSVKILAVNDKGDVVGEESRTYPLERPFDKWSEQDPKLWWEGSKDAIKALGTRLNLQEVAAISFGGQMHGLVALDSNNNVLRNAILWNDGRTEKQSNYLNEVIGKEKLTELTGNFSFPGFTLPKILWIEENEKELFDQISMILLPKDYVAFKFSGVYSTDYSDAAGTLLLNVKDRKWSEEMCKIGHVSINQLPKLYESFEAVGTILPQVAAELGINKDALIVAGAGDNAAAAIGTGCVKDGACNVSLGTSGTIFAASDKYIFDKECPLHSFDHANGKYHLMGCILTAASANQWWIKDILASDYGVEISKITEDDLGNNSVLFAPYLNGERCPYNDVNVKGAFIGLSAGTTRKDMCQSIMEGVSFALNDCLELMRNKGLVVNEITLCGGGAKNLIWAKMIANIMNVKVNFVKTEQGPGYGAAILGMVAAKKYSSVEEACDAIVERTKTLEPVKEIVEKYQKKYSIYKKIYSAVKGL